MLNGEINVADVPEAWNEQFKQLFGITPPDDTHGCLQDIHWAMGGLGYFCICSKYFRELDKCSVIVRTASSTCPAAMAL